MKFSADLSNQKTLMVEKNAITVILGEYTQLFNKNLFFFIQGLTQLIYCLIFQQLK